MKSTDFLRGTILKTCYEVYPDGIPEIVLREAHYQYHRDSEITRALNYLVDKNYLSKNEQAHAYKQNAKWIWYKITTEGIDLVERHSVDKGVIID